MSVSKFLVCFLIASLMGTIGFFGSLLGYGIADAQGAHTAAGMVIITLCFFACGFGLTEKMIRGD